MDAAVKIPITRSELLEIGTGLVRFPATWEEYWELLGKVEYNIEYQNGEIIAMGYESNPHGKIITELVRLLGNTFEGLEFSTFSENRPVYIGSCQKVYNPDVFLITEPSILFEYSKGLNAETNPFIIIEVLSKSTYDHDWKDKLPCYKGLPSVEHILFIESRFPAATHFIRKENVWKKTFYDVKEDVIEIRGNNILLEDVYRKTLYF